MNWTEKPLTQPHVCAVVPGRGAAMEPKGFFDCGSLAGIDPQIYVSWAGAELLAEKIGWVDGQKHLDAELEIKRLEDELQEAHEENSKLESLFEAIDTLESAGHRARKKKGRPPKQPVEA